MQMHEDSDALITTLREAVAGWADAVVEELEVPVRGRGVVHVEPARRIEPEDRRVPFCAKPVHGALGRVLEFAS